MAERLIESKSYEFAVKVVNEVRKLRSESREYELINQLVRSGTSIGANVSEATYAQSDKDFHMKHRIALKEANETRYWLRLFGDTGIMDTDTAGGMISDVDELIKIIASIIRTTQTKLNQ